MQVGTSWLMPFDINAIYQQIFKIWRTRRYKLFLDRINPQVSDILLDVGGCPETWTSNPQPVQRIDCLNVYEAHWNPKLAPRHNLRTLVGDGCALPFANKSYDIVFSNSVIEHVGSWERQSQFASEIRRVAQTLWVQTPAYECPIEPHYLAPFIHYLPAPVQKKSIRWFTLRGWIGRPTRAEVNEMVDSTRLLKKSEFRELFPDCEIVTERLLWIFPKSYIAIRRAP